MAEAKALQANPSHLVCAWFLLPRAVAAPVGYRSLALCFRIRAHGGLVLLVLLLDQDAVGVAVRGAGTRVRCHLHVGPLIRKIYAAVALMGNDHILSLRTGDALVQCGAPALGRRMYVPGVRRAFRVGEGRLGLRCKR